MRELSIFKKFRELLLNERFELSSHFFADLALFWSEPVIEVEVIPR